MYSYSRKVQYHETDKMGIVHHANYIKWMEEARIAFLESIDLPFQLVEAQGVASPVSGLSIDYKKPTTFGDEVQIGVRIARYNSVQLEFAYEMKNAGDGAVVATATSEHCFFKGGRLIALKRTEPDLHAILEAAFQAGAAPADAGGAEP